MADNEYQDTYLIPEVDPHKTAARVRRFFTDKLERQQNLAGITLSRWIEDYKPKSPIFDGMPKQHSSRNSIEDKIIRDLSVLGDHHVLNAGLVVKATKSSITCCSVETQTIIIGLYVDGKTNADVQEALGYEQSQYQVHKVRAYNEFADVFQRQSKMIGAHWPDLHVYKNRNLTVKPS